MPEPNPEPTSVQRVRAAQQQGDVTFLIWALTDTDDHARWLAAKSLGQLRTSVAVEPLLKGAQYSSDEVFQAHCLRAIERIGDVEAIPGVYEIAIRPGPFGVRTSAMRALASLGDRRSIPLLAEIVVDPSLVGTYAGLSTRPEISNGPAKRWASEQLLHFRGVEAIPILTRGVKNLRVADRLRTRLLVARLRRLGGHS